MIVRRCKHTVLTLLCEKPQNTNQEEVSTPHMKTIGKSRKLDNVWYEIRGPILAEAKKMEDEGHRILKLNIGNPAPFGFEAPDGTF